MGRQERENEREIEACCFWPQKVDVYKRQAYAYANIHEEFMRGHVTIIGCPKLDAVDYSERCV